MRDIITELETRIADDLAELDVSRMYDDMLNECYDFAEVGGPFSYMLASKILSECDPVAYRCGFNDWLDGEELVEIDDEYYYQREAEAVKDGLIDELKDEISTLEDELSELKDQRAELESDEDEAIGNTETAIGTTQEQIDELEESITKLRKYSF